MPSVDVINLSNEKKGTVNLDDRVFGVGDREALLHEAVVMQRANQRQGTASTKTRGRVRGGGKKPWKQKGTGRARAGSIRSPLWKGGGVVFGPKPRSYAKDFPRQKGRIAMCAALTARVQSGRFKVVEDLSLSEPKSKILAKMMKGLGLDGRTLILMDQPSVELLRAAQNIPSVTVQDLGALNVVDTLRHRNLVVKKADLEALQNKFLNSRNGK